MRTIILYLHTLSYLRPVQFYGRLWFRLARPKPDISLPPQLRVPSGPWCAPAKREASLVSADRFCFLGVAGSLSALAWDGPQREKLWRYNQHYFDDLNAKEASERVDWHQLLLADWVQRNSPGIGTGWEPYPTSLRIVNWIKWALAGNPLPEACVHSLAVQARWLTKRLEVHLLGNHLFANAKALVFAGLFFDGPEADTWLSRGLVILAREVPEQILADGGHFERSTMYHALALEDMLDLCNIARCYATAPGIDDATSLPAWQDRVPAMMTWLHTMCHPDTGIGFFNDAAFGIAPDRDELDAYAARLQFNANYLHGSDIQWLSASGYARLSSGDAVALLDLAQIGPDYLPGHAHADTLSFELSLGLQRVLVNSGTSCYGVNSERLRQRGTAAHNTVTVDGQDSSEVWGGFRVARRARPTQPVWDTSSGIQVRCAHDGYTRLLGKPLHERRWRLEGNRIQVTDYVSGAHGFAEARFHFYPGLELTATDNALRGVARLSDGREMKWVVTIGDARLEQTTWHPRFGVNEANRCLIVRLKEGHSQVEFNW